MQLVCSDNVGTGKAELSLTVEDVSCTEVWLQISTRNSIHSRIVLTRDTVTLDTLTLTTNEMTLVDDSLLPSHRYVYTALLLEGGKSAQTIAETMDTTSHDFSWQIYTLGDGTGSSYLYDVAIINDTLAYAVGEIYQDYTKDYQIYNAAKWNGKTWELMRVYFPTVCGSPSLTAYPAKAIFSFDDEIWISSSGDKIAILKNGIQVDKFCLPSEVSMSINKLWGSSSNDLYAVGNNGLIAHYDGRSWGKIESGTEVDLYDIYGSPDGREVWTCGWNWEGGGIILRKVGNGMQKVWDKKTAPPTSVYFGKLNTVWMADSKEVILSGTGYVFRQSLLVKDLVRIEPVELGHFAYSLRGSARNDITLAGDYAMVWHYNGVSWRYYYQLGNISDRLYSISQKGGNVIVVGERLGAGALIISGRKN